MYIERLTICKSRKYVKFWRTHGALDRPIPDKYKEFVNLVIELAQKKTLIERLGEWIYAKFPLL